MDRIRILNFNTEVNSIVEINSRYKYFVAYLSDITNSYLLKG